MKNIHFSSRAGSAVVVITFAASLFPMAAGATPGVTVTAPQGGGCYSPGQTLHVEGWVEGLANAVNVALYYQVNNTGSTHFDSSLIKYPLTLGQPDAMGHKLFVYDWPIPSTVQFSDGAAKIYAEANDANGNSLNYWGASASFSVKTSCSTVSTVTNNPPATPSMPSGPTSGTVNQLYTYSVVAPSDPEGQQVKIVFDWGEGTSNETNFVVIGTTVTYSHAWSSPNTYSVRAKAVDQGGAFSNLSSPLSVAISSGTALLPADTIPAVPTELNAFAISSTQVSLSWRDNAGNEEGFKIFRKLAGATSWSHIGTAFGANVTGYSDITAAPQTAYEYKVNAYNSVGLSGDSNVASVTTPGGITGETIPAVPSNLSGQAVSSTAVNLSWTDNSTNEQEFKIYREGFSGISGQALGVIATIGANTTSFSDTAVSAGWNYFYHLKACNSSGCSTDSNYVSVTTPGSTVSGSISGTVKDPDGALMASVEVRLFSEASGTSATIQTGSTGTYSFGGLSLGNYYVGAVVPQNRTDLRSPDPQFVSITSDVPQQTRNLQFLRAAIGTDTATLSGFIKDSAGTVVTGVAGAVWAMNLSGWRNTQIIAATGRWELIVPQGSWTLGYRVDATSGWTAPETYLNVTVVGGESKTIDLPALVRANAVLSGTVRSSTGAALSDVHVIARNQITYSWIDVKTNSSGAFTMNLSAGTWDVGVDAPSTSELAPPRQTITLAQGESKTISFQFFAPVTGVTVSGQVKRFGEGIKASVWAWSKDGRNVGPIETNVSGSFTLKLVAGIEWHVNAGAYIDGVAHKAADVVLTPQGGEQIVLDLAVYTTAPPPSSTTGHNVTQYFELKLQDGFVCTAPANTFGTTGTVDITITPDATVPDTSDAIVVGTGYNIAVQASTGASVTTFSQPITVSIPYTDDLLAQRGIAVSALQIVYYNNVEGRWVVIPESVVDETTKTVRASIGHLTRFALVSAADTVPPPPPTGTRVARAGEKALNIVWTNPKSDFHHVKIYRSTASGQLGELVVDNFTGTGWHDQNLTNGTRYYYNLKAVDPAGNVSTSNLQSNNTPSSVLEGNLTEGMLIRGPDGVKVYIVNAYGYKRHIFNPAVFGMYSHFSWSSIRSASQDTVDAFITSDLYRAPNDFKVYSLKEIDEARGIAQKQHLEITAEQFTARFYNWLQVFTVNDRERDYYQEGTPIR